MEEKRRDEIEIDWGELGGALLSKSLLILIITALCAVAAFFGTKWLISPKYTSTSSVYIMNRQNESQISASDLSSADMLTKDCQKLALSRNVLDEVSERLGLGLDYGQMIMQILSIVIFLQISQVVYSGCLRGAGDTRYTALVSLISVTLIRPGSGWLFCYPLGLGLFGAWIGLAFDQLMRFILTRIRFAQGKWTSLKI